MSNNYSQKINKNGNNDNKKPKGKKDDLLCINIDPKDTKEFDDTMAMKLTTTNKLAKEINSIFTPVFSDYFGCIINAANNLDVNLYFKPQSINNINPNKYHAIEENVYGSDDSSNIMRRLDSIYTSTQKKNVFRLTSEASQILYEFLNPALTNGHKKINAYDPQSYINANIMVEIQDRAYNYGGQPYYLVMIQGLDIIKFISKIYGDKCSNGSKAFYQVQPCTALNNVQPQMPNANWVISIQKLDSERLAELASEVGLTRTEMGVPVVTGC